MRDFRGRTLYTVPSMFLEELPREAIQEIDEVGHSRPAIEEWRGGGEAARPGWDEAGVRPKPEPAPQVAPPNADTAGAFAAGMHVRHATYGNGRIIEVSGQGMLRRVKIRFATAGERTFVADKVKLEILRKA
jgi:DNA helicase-2/ATP-dependent DNA helicase PcrA